MKRTIRSLVAGLALTIGGVCHAGLGDPIYVAEDGNVMVQFLGYEAAYTNTLWLHSPVLSGPIFVNKTTPVGSIFDLGPFPAGTPLVFDIFVHNTGHTYYTGDASANPDNVIHALVDFLCNYLANVGFEDLWNGGDRDYNDLRFSVSNVSATQVPEPSTYALLLAALLALAVVNTNALRLLRRSRISH
jgi:hypothetical protein